MATGEIPSTATDLIESLERSHPDWGFKDPRSCLTYPFWRRVLPPHRLVVVFRGLGQVLERYRAGFRHPLRTMRVVQAWTIYNWSILRYVEESEGPVLMLRYERMMNEPDGLEQLEEFIERPVRDVRDPLRHRSRSSSTSLPAWLAPLLARLPMHPVQLEARLAAMEAA